MSNFLAGPWHEVPLVLRGWDLETMPYAGINALMPDSTAMQEKFDSFVDLVCSAIRCRNLPVYRMADGEFTFLVGPQSPPSTGLVRGLIGRIRNAGQSRVAKTCWGEEYTRNERTAVMPFFVQALRHVANHGVLALYFIKRSDRWGEQYIDPMRRWFSDNDITISEQSYAPFYFPYALLTGPRRREFLGGQRVAVVTSGGPQRFQRIREGLEAEGVKDVRFLEVPPRKALLLESVNVRELMDSDVALVAAGIGSLRILDLLKHFPGPCIDCGAALEAFVSPRVRVQRAFLRLADVSVEARARRGQ